MGGITMDNEFEVNEQELEREAMPSEPQPEEEQVEAVQTESVPAEVVEEAVQPDTAANNSFSVPGVRGGLDEPHFQAVLFVIILGN